MATDFWSSSHNKRWIVDRATLKQARIDDLHYVENAEQLDFLNIYFANVISKLGKRLQVRQRVIATATVFFRRFYTKNSYCETDPFIVISACCYVAAKAEESPVHIKNVVSESRLLFSREILTTPAEHAADFDTEEEYGIKHFPSDNSKLAEMEFYLVHDLECDLIVFHPYRTLMALCGKEAILNVAEAGELGIGVDGGPRYWGTGEGKLELEEGPLQMAWFIINDTYRSELCLLYPPHMIAIAAIYLTLVLNVTTRAAIQTQAQAQNQPAPPPTRRSSRTSSSGTHKKAPQDIVGFMAGLNVSMSLVATIAQEIIALYTLWDRYKEDATPESSRSTFGRPPSSASAGTKRSAASRDTSVFMGSEELSTAGTPRLADDVVTPAFLTHLLFRMREARLADVSHPATGRPVAVNKMLERTQAAG
ncbi:cyclin-like protein [Artomyces pyxidatus]|uniref:Cyclin-like protein n=1 Tax=Artomyces pyxidatus TaxID=48021 RepID=A0ACB8SMU1_9AGAM|nr:cyclin-like protein [Artomyces pyxidatus]